MSKKTKTFYLLFITIFNFLFLLLGYPFGCSYNQVCQNTTAGVLAGMVLFIPLLLLYFGLLAYFSLKKKTYKYLKFVVVGLFILLSPALIPPLGKIIGRGFDIDAADAGIYPTFMELLVSSYVSILRVLIPINILFVLLREKSLLPKKLI